MSNVGWICSAILSLVGFATLLLQMWRNRQTAAKEMRENTDISREAFTAANSFNEKIQKINERLKHIEKDFVPGTHILKRLQSIDERLTDIANRPRE